jgi:hypothetical protein
MPLNNCDPPGLPSIAGPVKMTFHPAAYPHLLIQNFDV